MIPATISDKSLTSAASTPCKGSVNETKVRLPVIQEREKSPSPIQRVAFFDPKITEIRKKYLLEFILGCVALTLAVFSFFSVFWGALYKAPVRNLDGMVVDFDGDVIGSYVSSALTSGSILHLGEMAWRIVPADRYPGDIEELANEIREQHTWAAVAVHQGATQKLRAAALTKNASYDGSEAITLIAAEARNENAYRNLIRPSAQAALQSIAESFATQFAIQQASSSPANVTALLTTAPWIITKPISYTTYNITPFDVPVATALTFVGLIFLLIISFFIVLLNYYARERVLLDEYLTTRSLIALRMVTTVGSYFWLSLIYAFHSLAFKVDFTRKFGHGGFPIFWMLNFAGMLACGLALESLMTLLTIDFMPFFLLFWIICNLSVTILPIEVLPVLYRYGYVAPFYNLSHAARCIIFGTKNTVGDNFAVLIVWIIISCISLPLIQILVRRRHDARQP
ncbi:Nitrosoguanidine resistance protein SNG1 [Leucoagaricus sp. SymC.cos]|nr:Nitrosoguanidine resistance protein SNG1 [Leucoagaricus sp. SymC.cos]